MLKEQQPTADGQQLMTILVTGGAGFIGSNFIRLVLKERPSYKVINLDALTYAGNLENLRDVEGHPQYRFIKGNICDRNLVEEVFGDFKPNIVVNFAAESHVDRSIEDPRAFLETNIIGTYVLLETARKYWNQTEAKIQQLMDKFIQVSTDEVYGELGEYGYFTEESPLAPNSPYSASKASADMLARAYFKTYKLPVIITRCSNNYGQYQFPEKLIPLMITNALEDKELPVYGDGMNVRDWIHVEDHCRGILAALERGIPGEVYNFGCNNERKNIEIVELILKELGKPRELIRFVKDRPGHDRRYAIDASKARKELGWEPKINFEEGIRSTIQWYIENKEWWQRIKSGEYREYYEKMYSKKFSE